MTFTTGLQVIMRKLVQVVTPSTSVDGDTGPDANHLLAIKEVLIVAELLISWMLLEENNGLDNGSVVYGFVFVDCARLRFWVGSIEDDASCSALGALLMQVSPKEVIYESRGLCKEAQKALRKFLLNGQLTPVQSITDLMHSEISDLVLSKGYFKGLSNSLDNCSETASVLQKATQNSLVILDELGRGTSTFDGYAIAYAVFRHLVEKVNCRLLFATHYHPLTKEFASHPHVTMQHMACALRDRELVFLYRLAAGPCPESYGLQVALMAGIPVETVKVASKASQQMKESIGKSFRSSEQRSEFSTLHEEWLKTLVSISRIKDHESMDDDTYDTFVCMWYEIKNAFRSGN
ncbi:hypothetical protein RIF29_06617 [Crotalaria pallida]|uniref:DNA mismatch repair proteins mutS family domain-containing protein n=1 Tax=Crotalaria pallida TaxID=3830 RepID=A0AAN9PB03_CROPI